MPATCRVSIDAPAASAMRSRTSRAVASGSTSTVPPAKPVTWIPLANVRPRSTPVAEDSSGGVVDVVVVVAVAVAESKMSSVDSGEAG